MKLKPPSTAHIKTIGYARRSDLDQFDYIGWTKETAFDLPLVYRADLDELHVAHKKRYAEMKEELRNQLVEAYNELEAQCEQIRELQGYISTHVFVAEDNYEKWVEPTNPVDPTQL